MEYKSKQVKKRRGSLSLRFRPVALALAVVTVAGMLAAPGDYGNRRVLPILRISSR